MNFKLNLNGYMWPVATMDNARLDIGDPAINQAANSPGFLEPDILVREEWRQTKRYISKMHSQIVKSAIEKSK